VPKIKEEITLEGYHFVKIHPRITVKAIGKMDDEELENIARLYEEHYRASRKGGKLYWGKWQWCLNFRECRKAVYVPRSEAEKRQGKIVCSRYCKNRVQVRNKFEEEKTVVIGDYVFFVGSRSVVVASQAKHDEAELRFIAWMYGQHLKESHKPQGRPMAGEWRWCMNPECRNAFYALQWLINKGRGVCCSHRCSSIVFGPKKGERVGKSVNRPARLAAMWGLSTEEIKQAQKSLVFRKLGQRGGLLKRTEVLVFLYNLLHHPETDYLTVPLASELCYWEFGRNTPSLTVFQICLGFLVQKMPNEILMDASGKAYKYFAQEKLPKIKAVKEQEEKEAAEERESLKGLIKNYEGDLSLIAGFLRKQGKAVRAAGLSNFITQDEELNELAQKVRRIRKERAATERTAKRALEYPNKGELKQLIKDCGGSLPQITEFLIGQGKNVSKTGITRLINGDQELKRLVEDERYSARYPSYIKSKKRKATVKKEESLPLSAEEIEVLSVYQKGDSLKELIEKTKKPGGRISIIITSILTRKQVATLEEAKEKSKEELIAV
jgi:hypothetical protein